MAEKKNTSSKLVKPQAIELCDVKTGEFKYLLDFTRDSVEWAEDSQKFNISELDEGMKGSAITKLFYYSFPTETSRHNYEVDFLISRKNKRRKKNEKQNA